jgi:DNA replication and repair protein RecF
LKNIKEWKCEKSEIIFWNKSLINKSREIYDYRLKITSYFSSKIRILKELLWLKIDNLQFNYITKVDLNNIETSIENYLTKNLDRDIIIWNTHIWPHVDDFQIILDWFSLINFASRWETKSVILWLKIIESQFIEENTNKETIFLIDDLFSELDETHEMLLLNEISNKQVIITSIRNIFNNDIWNFTINL